MRIPFSNELERLFRSDRSVWLKIGGGAFVGFAVSISTVVGREENSKMTNGLAVGLTIVTIVIGGLIGFVLALKDVVRRRYENGQPVNPLLRFCLASRATLPLLTISLALLIIFGLILVMETLHVR